MKSCMRSKDKLGFARKHFSSPVNRSQFYSLRKQIKVCKFNRITRVQPSIFRRHDISIEKFRCRGIRPLRTSAQNFANCTNQTIQHGKFKCLRGGFLCKISNNENILTCEVTSILNKRQVNKNISKVIIKLIKLTVQIKLTVV